MTDFHKAIAPAGDTYDAGRTVTELPFAQLLADVDGNPDPSRDPGVSLIGSNSFDNYGTNDGVPPNSLPNYGLGSRQAPPTSYAQAGDGNFGGGNG